MFVVGNTVRIMDVPDPRAITAAPVGRTMADRINESIALERGLRNQVTSDRNCYAAECDSGFQFSEIPY
jgi:hypothetical protein